MQLLYALRSKLTGKLILHGNKVKGLPVFMAANALDASLAQYIDPEWYQDASNCPYLTDKNLPSIHRPRDLEIVVIRETGIAVVEDPGLIDPNAFAKERGLTFIRGCSKGKEWLRLPSTRAGAKAAQELVGEYLGVRTMHTQKLVIVTVLRKRKVGKYIYLNLGHYYSSAS